MICTNTECKANRPLQKVGFQNNKQRWICPICKKKYTENSQGRVGRIRKHQTNADRQKAYRQNKKEKSMNTTTDQTTEKRSSLRLSPKQQQLLDDIKEASRGSSTAWIECYSEDFRSAKALERKGLIEIVSDRSGVLQTFEVRLKEEGR